MLAFKSLARNLEVVVSPDTNFKLPQEPVHEILRMLLHFWYILELSGWKTILCHSSLWPEVIFSALNLNSKSIHQPVMQALYGFESACLTSTDLLKVLKVFLMSCGCYLDNLLLSVKSYLVQMECHSDGGGSNRPANIFDLKLGFFWVCACNLLIITLTQTFFSLHFLLWLLEWELWYFGYLWRCLDSLFRWGWSNRLMCPSRHWL